jgi:archaellum component FlaD/FlaE
MAAKNNPTADNQVNETVELVKKSILQQVIENNYLRELVSGAIWDRPENEIKDIEEKLEKFRKVIAAALKMHDEELKVRRDIHGSDHLNSLEYFRKPRDSKGNNSLLDDLNM